MHKPRAALLRRLLLCKTIRSNRANHNAKGFNTLGSTITLALSLLR